jgi:hypothetical protein
VLPTGRAFIELPALLRGRPAMKLNYLVDHVMHVSKPLDWDAVSAVTHVCLCGIAAATIACDSTSFSTHTPSATVHWFLQDSLSWQGGLFHLHWLKTARCIANPWADSNGALLHLPSIQ